MKVMPMTEWYTILLKLNAKLKLPVSLVMILDIAGRITAKNIPLF